MILFSFVKEVDCQGDGDKKLNFAEFVNLFRILSDRPELRRIFAM